MWSFTLHFLTKHHSHHSLPVEWETSVLWPDQSRLSYMPYCQAIMICSKINQPETNNLPVKIGLPNRKIVFQPSICRGYVSFRDGNQPEQKTFFWGRGGFRSQNQHLKSIPTWRGFSPPIWNTVYGCFLKWWYPENTTKWSFLVGKPMIVGYHPFRNPPYAPGKHRNSYHFL